VTRRRAGRQVFVKDKAGQLLEERYKVFRMICKLILQVGRAAAPRAPSARCRGVSGCRAALPIVSGPGREAGPRARLTGAWRGIGRGGWVGRGGGGVGGGSQGHAKMVLQRIRYGRMSGSAVAIQKTFRMWSAVQHRRRKLEAVRVLQTHCRCAALRVRMVRRRLAAQRLQARLRSAVRWVVQRAKRRGGARLQAALRRRQAASRYGQLVAGIIAREREEAVRVREEASRRQLAEEERVRAEQVPKR
jgi:hypothetical protein